MEKAREMRIVAAECVGKRSRKRTRGKKERLGGETRGNKCRDPRFRKVVPLFPFVGYMRTPVEFIYPPRLLWLLAKCSRSVHAIIDY